MICHFSSYEQKAKEALQALCRKYLGKLRCVAKKHGLGDFVDETIKLNKANKCQSTEREYMMLARMVDEERLHRTDVPKLLGKSYTQCALRTMILARLKNSNVLAFTARLAQYCLRQNKKEMLNSLNLLGIFKTNA